MLVEPTHADLANGHGELRQFKHEQCKDGISPA